MHADNSLLPYSTLLLLSPSRSRPPPPSAPTLMLPLPPPPLQEFLSKDSMEDLVAILYKVGWGRGLGWGGRAFAMHNV